MRGVVVVAMVAALAAVTAGRGGVGGGGEMAVALQEAGRQQRMSGTIITVAS